MTIEITEVSIWRALAWGETIDEYCEDLNLSEQIFAREKGSQLILAFADLRIETELTYNAIEDELIQAYGALSEVPAVVWQEKLSAHALAELLLLKHKGEVLTSALWLAVDPRKTS